MTEGQNNKITRMQRRREYAILAGIGTARRKFVITKDERKANTAASTEEGERMYVRVPVHRYIATASGKLCKGKVNHKCLFSRNDTLDLLCPETVQDDGQATVFVHRAFKNRDILAQRNINMYMRLLCFKAAGLAEFRVVYTGHAMFGECEECVCVQPVEGTNLWIDKRLLVHPCTDNDTIPATTSNESALSNVSMSTNKNRNVNKGNGNNFTEERPREGEIEIKCDSEQGGYEYVDYVPDIVYNEEWTNGMGCQVYSTKEDKCK